MSTKLSDMELADRQLAYEEMMEHPAWKLLEQRMDELDARESTSLGKDMIAKTRPTPGSTLSDQMLEAFVNVAYRRGIIYGMKLIVREPERISKAFNAAVEGRENEQH